MLAIICVHVTDNVNNWLRSYEQHSEKTCLGGSRPGPTQTGLLPPAVLRLLRFQVSVLHRFLSTENTLIGNFKQLQLLCSELQQTTSRKYVLLIMHNDNNL